jgi:hypothetical protein
MFHSSLLHHGGRRAGASSWLQSEIHPAKFARKEVISTPNQPIGEMLPLKPDDLCDDQQDRVRGSLEAHLYAREDERGFTVQELLTTISLQNYKHS